MKNEDVSYRSMNILEEKISSLFNTKILMPDWPDSKLNVSDYNIVFIAGLFYQRIFELNYWPKNDFQLFCLSPSVKSVLTRLLEFDTNSISALPRYLLFPNSAPALSFPKSQDFSMVHGGRISPQKNIEFLVFINFYFQLLYSDKILLYLFGGFDNEHHRNILGINDCDYNNKIITLINSLPWPGAKPTIISNLDSDQWLDHFPSNGVFLSASNLVSEDFSVAVAQIQNSIGAPCLLPHWGGFKDIIGENIEFYNVGLIGTSNESLQAISSKAKIFVQSYLNNSIFLPKADPDINFKFNYPEKINREYLQDKIDLNRKRWGEEIDYIVEGKFHLFAKSKNGQRFFDEYKKIFS